MLAFVTGVELNFSTIPCIDTEEPAKRATTEMMAMMIFLYIIQLNLPRPRSQLWTVSTIAGVRRPRLDRKMAPLKLMKSSRSGNEAAMATEKKVIK